MRTLEFEGSTRIRAKWELITPSAFDSVVGELFDRPMSIRIRALLFALLAVGSFRSVASARADSRLLVLGLVGDGDFRELEESLVEAARLDERFRVVGDAVRPDVARREARCPAIDDACLLRLSARRDVDRVLYGSVAPSAHDPSIAEITLHLFDRFTLRTRDTWVGTIEASHLDQRRTIDDLTEKFVPLFARLPEEGTAIIRAEAGAQVLLDGRTMGIVPPSGELSITPLRVGRRILHVTRPNAPTWEAPIVVRSRDSIRVTIGMGSAVLGTEPGVRIPAPPNGEIEPPPDWVLTIPGNTEVTTSAGDIFTVGEGLARVRFSIPILEEHVQRGEIRTTTNARVSFLPNVSGSGARVTAKLQF